jgi:hypothetical protein
MKTTSITLCFPDREKSCFACCPPIRLAGYEHIQYKNIVRRILRENGDGFNREAEGIVPITGFSCWALGYMDKEHRLVGCMLHPAQNGERDLRYRVDYGEKCQREFCFEAKVFAELKLNEKTFWLHLADGLDCFSYSSRNHNPLVKMMGWGRDLLCLIAFKCEYSVFTRESFFQTYPFFSITIPPRANAYLINWLINKENLHILKSKTFTSDFQAFSMRISKRLSQAVPNESDGRYVHQLDFDRDFLDLLRLSARILKVNYKDAMFLKKIVDDELKIFGQSLPL